MYACVSLRIRDKTSRMVKEVRGHDEETKKISVILGKTEKIVSARVQTDEISQTLKVMF